MKKILFGLLLSFIIFSNVKAFNIDINKISVDSQAKQLSENLNKTYNIETPGFKSEEVNNEEVNKLVKEVVKISLSSDSMTDKRQEFTKYMYYSNDDGAETLSGNLFIKMYLDVINEMKIEADYIKDIRTVKFNENDIISFVYISDALVDKEEKDIFLSFWLKEDNGKYGVYYPWITVDDDLESYFSEVSKREDKGEYIGGTYNKVSLSGKGNVTVSTNLLNSIYQNNIDSVVQITGMNDGGQNSYGSGFYLREGIIVTTWSLFLQMLTNSEYIYVNDAKSNTYDILGVVAAQIDYDVVVLKIDKNSGKGVSIGSSTKLELDDKLFMINSKNNNGFQISYGSFISLNNGKLSNLFLLSNSDVGGALFNEEGQVVGFNVGDKTNSELSYANSTDYLKELQDILNNQDYSKISYTLLETYKQDYYTEFEEEKKYNKIANEIWNDYRKIGNLGNEITLPLIKASYVDGIVSLRYENNTSNLIDSIYLVSSFTENLINDGYEFTYSDNYKKIYKNNEYKIIIKSSLDYLIILIMEN